MLRYVSSAQLVGILWAAYAFAWAFGGLIAHRLRGKLSLLVVFATLPYFIIALVDKWPSLIFFLIQAIASAALVNQIDTRVQEATPSRLRATITSVLSLIGRVVVIPASMIIGYTLRNYNAFIGARVVAIVAALILLVWIILGNKEVQKSTNL